MLQQIRRRLKPVRVERNKRFDRTGAWSFGLALTGLILAMGPSLSQPAIKETPLQFDIPSQSLVSALRIYGDATGREAIYKANLAAGRSVGHVQGVFTPSEALQRLLAGTGLSARFVAEDAFILSVAPQVGRAAVDLAQATLYRRYYALIQESLLDRLCRHGRARPGQYRMIATFWIAPSGVVADALRVGTTGIADVDQQIDVMLRGFRFSEPPPPGFAQPVRIMIVPHTMGVTSACADADARFHASRGGR